MEYGKFNSAEELLKGYNELEKSFTQKCQQLAELKAGLSKTEKKTSTTQPQTTLLQQGNSEQKELANTSLCLSERSELAADTVCHSNKNELAADTVCHSDNNEHANFSLCHSERAKRVEESSNPTTTQSGTNEVSSPLTTEIATDLTGSGNGFAVSIVTQSVTVEDKDSAAEENVCAVPADSITLSAVNDSPSSQQLSPIEQIKQYLAAHPDERDLLLDGSNGQARAPLPKVMASGGNVSLCLPSKPKTIKEASILAKQLFNT